VQRHLTPGLPISQPASGFRPYAGAARAPFVIDIEIRAAGDLHIANILLRYRHSLASAAALGDSGNHPFPDVLLPMDETLTRFGGISGRLLVFPTKIRAGQIGNFDTDWSRVSRLSHASHAMNISGKLWEMAHIGNHRQGLARRLARGDGSIGQKADPSPGSCLLKGQLRCGGV